MVGKGDVSAVVLVHGAEGYEVEFMTLSGETLAMVALSKDQVRPVGPSRDRPGAFCGTSGATHGNGMPFSPGSRRKAAAQVTAHAGQEKCIHASERVRY
ncbi:MAG: DUF4926 domain-containing protein [Chloroflexi bacterium]|nr:DUF4926 domain-containing protein [Chloroflexota bacterium]